MNNETTTPSSQDAAPNEKPGRPSETQDADMATPRIISAPEGLDVEQLMAEVRALVQEKRASKLYDEPATGSMQARSSFGAEWVTSVGEELDLLRAAARLALEGEPIRSHRPRIGRLIIAWKKFVRFWVRKYTDAIFLRQSFFNTKVVATLERLEQRVERLENELDLLRHEVARLRQGKTESAKNEDGSGKKNRP
ncbi:MAG: hypothetical protein ACPL7D_08505 [Candidatus Sumerlaeaceae bacterium]